MNLRQKLFYDNNQKSVAFTVLSCVFSLQSKLANMSNNFKTVLEERTENMKHEKDRRAQFSEAPLHTTAAAGSHGKAYNYCS